MAVNYLRSSDGSDTDNGTTWALANATLVGSAADSAAGDTTYASDLHNETSASAISFVSPGTIASPCRIVSVDDTSNPQPPTALLAGASVTGTGGSTITLQGSFYNYGFIYNAGTSTNTASIALASATSGGEFQFYDTCIFNLKATNTANRIVIGGASTVTSRKVVWKNCAPSMKATAQRISVRRCEFVWEGGYWNSGGTNPDSIFIFDNTGAGGCSVTVSGVDFSTLGSTVNIIDTAANPTASAVFRMRNCLLPTSWSGSLVSTALAVPGLRAEMRNCDSGSTNYKLWIEDWCGSIKDETSKTRSGGASDGTTSLSWKMVSSSNAAFPLAPLISPEIVIWNDITGSSRTITLYFYNEAGSTLKNDEIAIDVQYLGTSGSTMSSFLSSAKVDIFASAANQTSDTSTWANTAGTPVKQKTAVSITPQVKGMFVVRVLLYKASTTVYIDPQVVVT